MSRRIEDMQAEQTLTKVMDIWVWSRLKEIGNISTYIRETNKAKQINGTDVWLHTKNKTKISVDEKAQLYYINQNLPTFAFELGFIGQTGNVKDGWFINDKLDTKMYMLIYPYAKTTEIEKLEYSSFTKLECILISKLAIWRELCNVGLTKNILIEETKKMREKGEIGRKFFPNIDWCYLNMSNPEKYSETPINLVIKKDKLIEIANQIFIATPDKLFLGKGQEKGTVITTTLFGKIVQRTRN